MPQLFLLQKTEVRVAISARATRAFTGYGGCAGDGRNDLALCFLYGNVPRLLLAQLGLAIHDSGAVGAHYTLQTV